MIETLPTIGGIGALVTAVWLWRAAKIAVYLKALAVSAVVLGGLGLLGVVEVSVRPERIVELVRISVDAVSTL